MALHYWACGGRYAELDPPHRDSPAVREAHARFVEIGLLLPPTDEHPFYKRGPALEVWVRALKALPFPVQKWVIPTEHETSPAVG